MKSETTLLVVEDNEEMLANIVGILELAQYKVFTAMDGRSAVTVAHECRPDLIVCDVMMPQLDGFSLFHLLSKSSDTSEIPFIFLSAKAESIDIRKGMNLGACDYITKPFDGLELLNAIELRVRKNRHPHRGFGKSTDTIQQLFSGTRKGKASETYAEKSHLRKYKKREFLYLEGQKVGDIYYIHSGKVKTYATNREGKELILTISREGDFLGCVSAIQNIEAYETAVAVEDSVISILPKQDFLSALYTNREVAQKFVGLLASQVQMVERRLLEMAYSSVRQKVANALMTLDNNSNNSSDKRVLIISRKDMSNLIGTTIESLNRTLSDFKEEGLIDLKHDAIVVLDAMRIDGVAR